MVRNQQPQVEAPVTVQLRQAYQEHPQQAKKRQPPGGGCLCLS